jgi:hypothetical protein
MDLHNELDVTWQNKLYRNSIIHDDSKKICWSDFTSKAAEEQIAYQ